jgi:hypothetical protein
MLATILRRAFNDRLQRPGWKNFGQLLLADRSTPILKPGPSPGGTGTLTGEQVEKVWTVLKSGNKSLLVPEKP